MSKIKNIAEASSHIKNFEKVIKTSIMLLEDTDPGSYLSPYSLVPLISQFLGLNTPLMGSGRSPYSIISHIFQLQSKPRLFGELFELPLPEKRLILDEIYEMIAPCLLGEEDGYIDLLLHTRFAVGTGHSDGKIKEFKKIWRQKFLAIRPLIKMSHSQNGDFAHIVHYGYPEDLYREYDFLERLPGPLEEEWRNYSYPIVNEMILDGFPAYNGDTKDVIRGWVIFVPNYTRELLENGKLRKRKILQAARLAERLGARIVGMGGLIASFAQGGYWLSEQISDVGFTTGHAYTIGNIMAMMDNCLEKINADIRASTVSIVGAAGSIGSGCAKLLAGKGPRKIVLIDLSTFGAEKKLKETVHYMKKVNPDINVHFADSFKSLKYSDVIISATNAPKSLLTSAHFKSGAVIIDDSFPKNVPKRVLEEREDIVLLEGGVTRFPLSSRMYVARNMPDLMDAPLTRAISCKETYGCVAETLVLALHGYEKNYGLGYSDPGLAVDIMTKAERVGFSSAPFQCFDEAVDDKRFEHVRKIVQKRR